MPNIKSAIKKVRGDKKKTEQNNTYRIDVAKSMKAIKRSKSEKDRTENINKAVSLIDKSAKKNIFAKNKANRLKRKAYKLH